MSPRRVGLETEFTPCTCCRDLPTFLSCATWGTVRCPVCGWEQSYQDLDDAPEHCPECDGYEFADDDETPIAMAHADLVFTVCACREVRSPERRTANIAARQVWDAVSARWFSVGVAA